MITGLCNIMLTFHIGQAVYKVLILAVDNSSVQHLIFKRKEVNESNQV